MGMGKINDDYKHKYIILEIKDKDEKNILIDAIKKHIELLTGKIQSASKGESYIYASDIEKYAKQVSLLMFWRDKAELMGSDTFPSDWDFYKNGVTTFR